MGWVKMELKQPVCLAKLLPAGQSFQWIPSVTGSESQWTSVLRQKHLVTLKQGEDLCTILYKSGTSENEVVEDILQDYFQLTIDIDDLIQKWSSSELELMYRKGYEGVRVLRQEPFPTLLSFICSSNNNIPRITGMVRFLCSNYGDQIGTVDGSPVHAFPTLEQLHKHLPTLESELRKNGFGYRAKFISKTVEKLATEHESNYLDLLRNVPYEEAVSALTSFHGVGRKVADCVCLMSLDKTEAVPIDTHMRKWALKHGVKEAKRNMSMTDKVYDNISLHYRQKYGLFAGWAHQILFTNSIKL